MILAEHDVSAWDDKGVRDSGDETKERGTPQRPFVKPMTLLMTASATTSASRSIPLTEDHKPPPPRK